jgi:hemolysin III
MLFLFQEELLLSKIRQPVSSLTHLFTAFSALFGQAFLLTLNGLQTVGKAALFIYSSSLFLMFFASGIYHLIQATPRVTAVLRKFDHAAIYLLIAGTYTPFCLIAFHGFWKWGLLGIIWALALAGIAVKLWTIHTSRWLTAGIYVLMGWLVVFAFSEMLVSLSTLTIAWLFAGGVIYTLGALVYATKRLDFIPNVFGFHEVWHIFVMLGAAAHFVAVYSMLRMTV